ncbi:MAG: universal stress protein [Cytophagales bacterium]|nr:universal stress protein [Cytophagales bacterium]
MEDIKRILVAVDLTEMDESLVRYITYLSNRITIDKVYFINVMKNMELPDEIIEKYPNLVAPMDEATKNEIKFTIDEEAGNQLNVDYEIKVTDGDATDKILKWARIKEVDMIVLGRKSGLDGHGIVSSKIVKLAPCTVVFVPEVLPELLKRLLVPIDFSDASKLAVEYALFIADKVPGLKITFLNVYHVPTGYHVSGKSYEEFADIMKQNAKDSFNEFISEFDTDGVNMVADFVLDRKNDIAKKIYQFALKNKSTAIAVGSKGRTQAAAVLLGSISEKLIMQNSQIPTIVVKQPRHNMRFLEALLEI